MQLRVGDTLTYEEVSGVLIGRPFTLRGGKVVRALIQRTGRAAGLTRERAGPAYERIEVRR